ncbi:hypothetical protein GF342_04195 [Candidatus Woesearchaeota archaeon]|nr:hypothetical protein [Candidatus Woesearchaeota archaeon]
MRDIVIPQGNEKEFLIQAQSLGYDELWFLYENKKQFFTTSSPIPIKNILITKTRQTQKTAMPVTIETARNAVEHIRPAIIYGVEEHTPKDYIHQRGSGLNHIIARLAAKNNVAFGLSFGQVLRATSKRPAILGRLSQNIQLCRKFGVSMIIGSFASTPDEMRSPGDIASLFTVLGMHAAEIRQAQTSSL